MSADRPGPSTRARVWTLQGDSEVRRRDSLVTEEPLEIRLSAGGRSQTVAVTMRTPGNDFELAAGFLHAEGLLRGLPYQVSYCADVDRPDQKFNVVTVETDGPALEAPVRSGIVSSACGVCGSASLDALRDRGLPPVASGTSVPVEVLYGLPDALRGAQGVFDTTGGLHGAGLFTPDGALLAAREDVGRHNAVDKLVGWALLGDRLPRSPRTSASPWSASGAGRAATSTPAGSGCSGPRRRPREAAATPDRGSEQDLTTARHWPGG